VAADAPAVEHVSKAAALADVKQFFGAMKRVHPNLLAHVDAEGYRKLKEEITAGVAAKTDSNGPVAVEDLASLLYYAAAYFT
jgi:hypothetical protein